MKVEISTRLGLAAVGALLFLLLIIFTLGGGATHFIWQENGPIENASAVSYLTATALCGYFFFRTPRPACWYLALWGLLCVVFFGEETSWLQQQLGYKTPEWLARHNVQGEFNLHNLTNLQGGALLGDERPGWRTLFKSQHLFQVGFVAYFLLLPAIIFVPMAARQVRWLRIPYPGRNLTCCIWIPIIISVVLTMVSTTQTKSALAETREMIYALSILAFIACYVLQLARSQSSPKDLRIAVE